MAHSESDISLMLDFPERWRDTISSPTIAAGQAARVRCAFWSDRLATITGLLIREHAGSRGALWRVYIPPRWIPWTGFVSCIVLTFDVTGLCLLG